MRNKYQIKRMRNKKNINKFAFVSHNCVHLQQHAYPASRKTSALRVSFLFLNQ
jgi:hypothetical protein